ncbi:ABC transporter ATP-binding protein [Vibrio aerogenes]|uniref:ABC transporter ATP-binding protein n=1 Tax=Vibrio aerogenes TaxID=92172 RepID=UPI0021C2FB47|nr:ABC transporter ATP-binding protein [Vibrio aerogenes]
MNSSKHPNQFLLELIQQKKWYYSGSAIAVSIASYFMFLGPTIGQIAIDTLLSSGHTTTHSSLQWLVDWIGSPDRLWLAGVAIVVVTALGGLFMYLKDFLAARACEQTVKSLRERLFSHIHRLPEPYLNRADSGDLVQRCTSDVDTLREFLTLQVMDMGRTVILMCIVIPLMVMQSPLMTVISLCLMPVVFTFAWQFFRKVKAMFQLVDEAEGHLTTIVQENLTGIRVVRAFARQAYECEKFDQSNRTYSDLNLKLMRLLARFWATSSLLCVTQNGIVLVGGAWMAAHGHISVGTYFAFIGYAILLIWPIRQLGQQLSEAGKATVAIGWMQEILSVPEEQPVDEEQILPENFTPGIVFDRVSFAYDADSSASEADQHALKDVTFNIDPGETIAIVGPTGAGKSTLVQLLMRLQDYRQGSIQLGGYELNQLTRHSVRQHIGALLQEPFLYSRSLRDNIKLGRAAATDPEMIQASVDAAVHHTIERFTKQYDTVIGERGVSLSGGQKQRMTLSRTLLRDTPILVLDDTLSAVDSKTEQEIIRALHQKKGQQTLLIITHRISVCRHADRVFVMEGGRLTAQGTHADVEANNHFYRQLWKIQSHQQADFESELAV